METHQVGETAGKVWQHLAKTGPTFLTELPKAVGAGTEMTLMAIGWLAREDKIRFERKGKDVHVLLDDREGQMPGP
jgi:hypothetical protein